MMCECNPKIKRREDMSLEDIIKEHGLPFLPAKSLARFRSVCSTWDQLICNPFLAHRQTNCFNDFSGFFYQPTDGFSVSSFVSLDPSAHGVPSPSLNFLPERVVIRSSCNGLLCCQGQGETDGAYYVCNPVNMHWDVLPETYLYHGYFKPSVVLAFDPSVLNFSADYELICAVRLPDSPVVQFEVYSSRTGCWRLSNVVCCEGDSMELKGDGFYMNGIAYWETWSGEVLAFDSKNEHYGVLPLPPNEYLPGVLTEMHGELSYVQAYHDTDGNSYVIDIHGVQDLGLKQRIFLSPQVVGEVFCDEFQALPCINTDVLVIRAGKKVISYRTRDEKVVELGRGVGDFMNARYWPYVNSLVQLPPASSNLGGRGLFWNKQN